MTSWRIMTYLFVLVSLIAPSKEHCFDYFNIEEWDSKDTQNLGRSFILMEGDPTDAIKCTLDSACKTPNKGNQPRICDALKDCFSPMTWRESCKGQSSKNISFYHLMCLTAKAAGVVPEGCKYETVCELYPQIRPIAPATLSPATTTLSPATTTLSPATTTLSPAPATTTLSPAPATTTLSPATTTTLSPATTVLPSMTATTPGTTTVIRGESSDGNASRLNGTALPLNGTDASTMKCLLIISTILNIVLPLAVYLYMRRKTQDRTHDGTSVLDGGFMDPEAQPLEQKPECDSPSADTTRTACTTGHRSSP